jgi:DivIVA domain-containing protein
MIDLTPLDVRNKRGDFKRLMRGYDPQEVDVFLELVAERLEGLVRENIQLRERTQTLQQQVTSQLGREQAVQDALVTAQELRADIKAQSQREAEHVLKAAETEARRMVAEAEAEARNKVRGVERKIDDSKDSISALERRRTRFLKEFRQLLERELDVVEVEEKRSPLEERTIDLDLGASRRGARPSETTPVAKESPQAEAPRPAPTRDEQAGPPAAPVAPRPHAAETNASRDGQTPRVEPPPPSMPGATPSDRPARAERAEGRSPSDAGARELSRSVEVEAMAEAQSGVVEVKGTGGEPLSVPRLEEVLAEAGAELAEAGQQELNVRRDLQEIAPPPVRGRGDDTLLLYLDSDERER